MPWELIVSVCVPIISFIGYFYSQLRADVEMLKNEAKTKVTEDHVRTIVNDKVTPVVDDIKEIKEIINRVYDRLIDKK